MAYWNGSSDIKSAWTRRNAVFKAVCCTSSRVSVFCVRHLMTYYIHVWLTCGQSMFCCYIMYCVRISCWVAMLALYNKVKSLFFLSIVHCLSTKIQHGDPNVWITLLRYFKAFTQQWKSHQHYFDFVLDQAIFSLSSTFEGTLRMTPPQWTKALHTL